MAGDGDREHDVRVGDWAVVVPSYNHADDTITCLGSVWRANPRPGYLVVVDDASTDDAISRISEWAARERIPARVEHEPAPSVSGSMSTGLTIIARRENGGFPLACNTGLRAIRDRTAAPYALLLNNDAAVAPSFFAELASAVALHPGAGLVTGTIYEWDETTVWYAGGRIAWLRGLGTHITAVPHGLQPQPTEFVCGCTMLIGRGVLEEVGLLAECYGPGTSEDVDYTLRTVAAGFDVVYAPSAVAYHKVGRTLGRYGSQPPETIYVTNRNRGYLVRRNYRGARRAAALAYLLASAPIRAVRDAARQRRARCGWATLLGTLDGVFNPAAAV